MTKDNWLTIATIITANILALATLLAPALAEVIKARISQPNPSPVMNQPKNLIRRIAPFMVVGLCIALEVYLLQKEVNSPAPLDRVAVAFIAGLYASIVGLILAACLMRILGLIRQMIDLHRQHFDMSVFIYEVQKGTFQIVFDELDKLGKTPKSPPSNDPIDRMVSAIRKVFP